MKTKKPLSTVSLILSREHMVVLREVAEMSGESVETIASVIISLAIYRHLKGTDNDNDKVRRMRKVNGRKSSSARKNAKT